ncbi:hypothetical protein ANSO36C_18020 [Nostoc cf. commune SO-36]|uniref:Uncharacterized protein n=1 Tax=Nostoc cf. commune SO-36 TaxID=449208 RepID=A0ABM7YZ49_NOSCO|nr:hypothetical protein [Nostoc commune]BDI16000.1 hypothetical protein ANSO36C_18020 [Nostoc cf. commune SO-36]
MLLSYTFYQSSTELIEQVHLFEQDINSNPFEIGHRLWVKNQYSSVKDNCSDPCYEAVYDDQGWDGLLLFLRYKIQGWVEL